VTDVSGRTNLAGAGINMAQRVMDCGDAGHILLSQHVADDLVQYRQWRRVCATLVNASQAWRSAPFGQSLRRATGQRCVAAKVSTDETKTGAAQYRIDRRPRAGRDPRDQRSLLFHASSSDEGCRHSEKSIAVLPMVNSTGDPLTSILRRHVGRIYLVALAFAGAQGGRAHLVFSVQSKTDDSKTTAKSSASITCSKAACVSQPNGCASRSR